MAYFDTGRIAGPDTSGKVQSVFDRLVKFIAAWNVAVANRPGASPETIVAARQRAEDHRRAVDRLLR